MRTQRPVGCGGATPPPKLLIGENPGKICGIWQNLWKPWQNCYMCFSFTKLAPKITVQTFFIFYFCRSLFCLVLFGKVRGNLGKFDRNLGKNGAWSVEVCTDLKICTQLEKKCSRFSLVFWAVILGDFFRVSSGKNPSHPQKLACSYTYATDLTEGLKCERSGLAELTPHKTRASTGL